jgi:hypothetical protein
MSAAAIRSSGTRSRHEHATAARLDPDADRGRQLAVGVAATLDTAGSASAAATDHPVERSAASAGAGDRRRKRSSARGHACGAERATIQSGDCAVACPCFRCATRRGAGRGIACDCNAGSDTGACASGDHCFRPSDATAIAARCRTGTRGARDEHADGHDAGTGRTVAGTSTIDAAHLFVAFAGRRDSGCDVACPGCAGCCARIVDVGAGCNHGAELHADCFDCAIDGACICARCISCSAGGGVGGSDRVAGSCTDRQGRGWSFANGASGAGVAARSDSDRDHRGDTSTGPPAVVARGDHASRRELPGYVSRTHGDGGSHRRARRGVSDCRGRPARDGRRQPASRSVAVAASPGALVAKRHDSVVAIACAAGGCVDVGGADRGYDIVASTPSPCHASHCRHASTRPVDPDP